MANILRAILKLDEPSHSRPVSPSSEKGSATTVEGTPVVPISKVVETLKSDHALEGIDISKDKIISKGSENKGETKSENLKEDITAPAEEEPTKPPE